MGKVTVIARITTQPGKRSEALDTLTGDLAAVVAEDEPGCEVYSFHADQADDDVIWAFEVYADGDALGSHGKGDRFREVTGRTMALFAGRPEVHVCEPAGGKGFPF